ncbi:hypothetical protein ACO0R3_001761 [Hanseniaspora guilliermondii]
MAHFKFGKKHKKKSNNAGQADSSMTSNESANTTNNSAIDSSRPSISSNHQDVSGEQLFKNNILSNMLKKSDQRSTSTYSHNIEKGKSPNQRLFSSNTRSDDTQSPHSNTVLKNVHPVRDEDTDVKKIIPNKLDGQKHQTSLNSPFSLQSPSFTIVADSDCNNNSNVKKSSNLSIDNNLGKDHDESIKRQPMGSTRGHESHDSFSSTKDIQNLQSNPDLWLTEDDMFLLKPWDRIKLPISPFPRYRHSASNVSITVNNDSDSLISSDIYLIGGLHGNSVYGDTWKLRFTRRSVNNVDILGQFESLNKSYDSPNNKLLNYHIESKKYKLACSSTSMKISNQTPPPRVGHASVMCGNAFIVFGGDTLKLNANQEMDDDIYLFNINTKRWTIPNPVGERPCGRYGHKISVIQHAETLKDSSNKSGGTKLFLFGGQFDDLFFNDLYSFNLASFRKTDSHWDVIKPETFSPPPMSNHVMCTFDNKLYVFGGMTVAGLLNDIFMYDPTINDWKFIIGKPGRVQDGIPKPRQEHSCLVYKNLMCIYGGKDEEGVYLSDLWFFNFMSQKWFKFPEEKSQIMDKVRDNKVSPNCLEYQPLGRSGHSMSLLQKENKILIMGGDKLDYNTTVDLNDVFAITNDIDFEDIDGESNQHILGTTVYTFDLTCLKEFIPDVYDFNNESSLDLLNIPSPKKSEVKQKNVEDMKSDDSEEVVEAVIEHNNSNNVDDIPKGNQKIVVNRNSFPMLNQLKNQEKVTPTETAFDLPSEETSQLGGKDSAGGVSDFFDNYNDDEISVQLRNSMNSTHLLANAMKVNVIDHTISAGEESDDTSLKKPLSPKYHMMLETDTIESHKNDESEEKNTEGANIDTHETLTAENNNIENDSHHSNDLKSSGTEVEEKDTPVDNVDEDAKLEDNSSHDEVANDAVEDTRVEELSNNSAKDINTPLEAESKNDNEKVVNDQRDHILQEILKLREETFNAAKETSKIIKGLERQVKKLQGENNNLADEVDSLSAQVGELNMKNMELISANSDLHESKKNIINAMKLALSQIEKGHI